LILLVALLDLGGNIFVLVRNKNIMKKDFIQLVKIITLGIFISFGVGYLFAGDWTNPTGTPTGRNISTPITIDNYNQAKGDTTSAGYLFDVNGILATSGNLFVNTQVTIDGSIQLKKFEDQGLTIRRKVCYGPSGLIVLCGEAQPKLLTVTKTGPGLTGSLVVSTYPDGTINCTPTCSMMATDAVLKATPAINYRFSNWEGCTSPVGDTCNVTVTDPMTVTAVFADSIPPTMDTIDPTDITGNGAKGWGNTISNGGSPLIVSGLVWNIGTDPLEPTITNNDGITNTGYGIGGPWPQEITGLLGNTAYHIRAYGTNSKGTSYGEEKIFTTTYTKPILTTTAVSGIGMYTAISGGNITSTGGLPVTWNGVTWSKNPNPDPSFDAHTNDPYGTGVFTSSLTGLSSNTLYYLRAFAQNSVGISYGNPITFTTKDIICNGWSYNGYCWYKENTPGGSSGISCDQTCAKFGATCVANKQNGTKDDVVMAHFGIGSLSMTLGNVSTIMQQNGSQGYSRYTSGHVPEELTSVCSSRRSWWQYICSCSQ
jgi:hypothetical protein